MSTERPPSIDPVAAARWAALPAPISPWLHEEVGRRMAERLDWIRQKPQTWVDWQPARGGMAAHALVAQRYPGSRCHVLENADAQTAMVRAALHKPWWKLSLGGSVPRFEAPPAGAADMVWANMGLHMEADPQACLKQWHGMLAENGFLMFSCLGPDTLVELRHLYRSQGWAPPTHAFTDMHDWGDMLVAAGFAEPVMDMERITLTFPTAARLRAELRELGRNLHRDRFAGLRTPAWRDGLDQALLGLAQGRSGDSSGLALTFEVVYGHAFKPVARVPVAANSQVSLDDMRRMLRAGR